MLFRLLGLGGTAGLIVSAALGLLLVIQKGETRHYRKQAEQYHQLADNYKAQLDALSSKKNEQQVVTREKIKVALRKVASADDAAKKVEQAPLPGQCRTPREVLEADI